MAEQVINKMCWRLHSEEVESVWREKVAVKAKTSRLCLSYVSYYHTSIEMPLEVGNRRVNEKTQKGK